MDTRIADLFHGLFEAPAPGQPQLLSKTTPVASIPDPETGQPLKVAAVELSEHSVCPACTQLGTGGYISFVSDLRLAFACPSCRQLVWMEGA